MVLFTIQSIVVSSIGNATNGTIVPCDGALSATEFTFGDYHVYYLSVVVN